MTDSRSLRSRDRKEQPIMEGVSLEALISRPTTDVESLRTAASHASLTEDLALLLLERRDLPSVILDDLSKNGHAMKQRKVKVALVQHPRTPRHVSLPLLRRLYTFELMNVALTAGIAADVKILAEEALTARFGTISAGEKLTLAKRSSARVSAALLNDPDNRVVEAALNNPFLTEIWVSRAILRSEPSPILALQVCRHAKWSVRQVVREALLRCECTPLAQAIIISQTFKLPALQEILHHSDLPPNVKEYLLEAAKKRKPSSPARGKN